MAGGGVAGEGGGMGAAEQRFEMVWNGEGDDSAREHGVGAWVSEFTGRKIKLHADLSF